MNKKIKVFETEWSYDTSKSSPGFLRVGEGKPALLLQILAVGQGNVCAIVQHESGDIEKVELQAVQILPR